MIESKLLPKRDSSKPAEAQGLFRKFDVRRVDGSDAPGGKHHGCEYFVLDLDHDQHAPAALVAYANACQDTHPQLSADLLERYAQERPDILEKLNYHRHERDDMTLDDCLEYLANRWKKIPGRTERALIMQITELLASAPQQAVAASYPFWLRNLCMEVAEAVYANGCETEVDCNLERPLDEIVDSVLASTNQPVPVAYMAKDDFDKLLDIGGNFITGAKTSIDDVPLFALPVQAKLIDLENEITLLRQEVEQQEIWKNEAINHINLLAGKLMNYTPTPAFVVSVRKYKSHPTTVQAKALTDGGAEAIRRVLQDLINDPDVRKVISSAKFSAAKSTLLASQPSAQADVAEVREPWIPYLSDRADGVKGRYAICRLDDSGTRWVWNSKSNTWSCYAHEVLTLEQANNMLKSAKFDAPTKPAQKEASFTTGHCEHKKQPGGCPHHNVHCGYPDCDRRAAPTAQPQADGVKP